MAQQVQKRTPKVSVRPQLEKLLKTDARPARSINLAKGDISEITSNKHSLETGSFPFAVNTFLQHKLPATIKFADLSQYPRELKINLILNRKLTETDKKTLEEALNHFHRKHNSALFASGPYDDHVFEFLIKRQGGIVYLYITKTKTRRQALAQAGLIPDLAILTTEPQDFYISLQSPFRLSAFERTWARDELDK